MRYGAGCIGLALAMAVGAAAAPPVAPQEVPYQGVLLDDMGEPRTGTVDLTIRIHDALTGGTLLYKEVFSSLALNAGVFTIQLGPTGDATDTPVNPLTTSLADALSGDLPATGPSRFLEVTVGLDGALSRTQILTVPYALRAESAAVADVAVVATTALDAQNVNGLDATVLVEIFEHFNFDGGPPNDDPSEGLADTDADGIANFVDVDNDNDTLSDTTEVAQGSGINLVTPIVNGVTPPSTLNTVASGVTVQGLNFVAGLTVQFGSQTPTPSNVTATSFDVTVGPQPSGVKTVLVTLPNLESGSGSFSFDPTLLSQPALQTDDTRAAVDVFGTQQTVVAGEDEYAVDTDADGTPETVVSFAGLGDSQLAVAWNASGALVGARCLEIGLGTCEARVYTDADADDVLEASEGVLLASLVGAGPRMYATAIDVDSSGGILAGYVGRIGTNNTPRVGHDRNGDGDFLDTNESVAVETFSSGGNLAEFGGVVADGSDRAAYVYWDSANIRVAYDLSGDGDFDDTVGGNPELATLAAASSLDCLRAAADPSGNLAIVYDDGSAPPVVARDLNGDGDFVDAGETQSLGSSSGGGCGIAGGSVLTVVHNADGLRLLSDLNDDGDFADANEDLQLESLPGTSRLAVGQSSPNARYVVQDSDLRVELFW